MDRDTIDEEIKNVCTDCDATSMQICLMRGCPHFVVNKKSKEESKKNEETK